MTRTNFPGLNEKAFESQPSAIEQQAGIFPENQQISSEQIDLIGASLESVYSFVVPYHQNSQDDLPPQNWAQAIHKQFRVLDDRETYATSDNQIERTKTIRAQLRVSLRQLLTLWDQLSRGQKEHIAGAIIEQVMKCPEGLQEMLEGALQLTQTSATFNQLLCEVRTNLAKSFASDFLSNSNFNTPSHGVHNYTWLLRLAYDIYGIFYTTNYAHVSPIQFDADRVENIKRKLTSYFAQHYQLHNLVLLLREAIETKVFVAELGPNYANYIKEQCPQFGSLPDSYTTVVDKLNILLKSEGHTVTIHDVYQIDTEDGMHYFINGINWDSIEHAIWRKLQTEQVCQPLPSVEQLSQDGQAQYIGAYHLLALVKLKYGNSQEGDQLVEPSSAWIDGELQAVNDRIRQADCFGVITGKAVQEGLNHQPKHNLPLLAKWASTLSQSDYRLMLEQTSLVKYPHAQAITQPQFVCFYQNFIGNANIETFKVWLSENDPQAQPPTNRQTQLTGLSEETMCVILGKFDPYQRAAFLQALDAEFLKRNNLCLVHWLVGQGFEDGVRLLLDKNSSLVNVRNNKGKTPLHVALDNNNLDLVRQLLAYQPSIATEDYNGKAPVDYEMIEPYLHESVVNNNRKKEEEYDLRPLEFAVVEDNEQEINRLFQDGADINMVNQHGLSLLQHAVCKGAYKSINCLIERGLQVDANTDDRRTTTSLHLAAIVNKQFNSDEGSQTIRYLLKNGTVNAQDDLGNTPLYYLAENYYSSGDFCCYFLEHFLRAGADPGIKNKVGETAIDVCRDDKIKAFLSSNQKDENGQFPLEKAILSNDSFQVQDRLNQGAFKLGDDHGFNMLHTAVENGCDNVINFLVVDNSDLITQKDCYQRYPLELAIINNLYDTFNNLFDHSKNQLICLYPDDPDYRSNILFTAVKYSRLNMLDALLKRILWRPLSRQEFKDAKGDTLLNIVAHQTQHYDCARLLFKHGASASSENDQGIAPVDSEWLGRQGLLSEDYIQSNRKVNGQRPLLRAIEQGDMQDFKALLKQKAEVNIKPADGCTPLYRACQKGNAQMVYILIRCGARAVFSDDEHSPALSIAVQQGYSLIVEMLLSNSLKRELYDSEAELLLKQASRDAIIKMIRNNSIDPYQQPCELALDSAIDDGDSAKMTDLLAKGVLVHAINEHDGNTRVHQASALGHAEVVEVLIKHGVNPSVLNKEGLAAIHLAAQDDKANVIEVMAQLNCDINIPTRDDQLTPLHIAAKQGHVESIKQLHVEGAYLDAVSIYGETPLHLAIQSGHLPVINELIERGAALDAVTYYGDNPIHLAIKYVQSSSVLDKLIQSVDDLSRVDFDGLAPIHLAAKYGQLETLRFFKRLLINHVDGDNSQLWRLYDSQGNSPLHLAALHHHTLAAKWLLQNDLQLIDNTNNQGQKPLDLAQDSAMIKILKANQPTQQGQMSLFEAIEQKDLNEVKSLLANGALVDIYQASTNYTPMHLAVQLGDVDIMQVLAQYDAIDQIHQSTNVDRMQPLHLASLYKQKEAVRWLIQQGADIKFTDQSNRTPMDLAPDPDIRSLLVSNCKNAEGVRPLAAAIAQHDEQKARELIDNGAMMDFTDDQGNTALHQAIEHGCEQLAGFMVRSGCEVDSQNKQGDTPLNIAARTNMKHIIALLLQHNACVATENQSGVAPIDYECMHSFVTDSKRQANLREENTGERPLIKLLTYDTGPLCYGGLKLSNPQHLQKVEAAIDNGAEVHARFDRILNQPLHLGYQPLHLCAIKGYQNIIPSLCNKGADVNARDFKGRTPLHLAARAAHPRAVSRLIDHGAQYELTDKQGYTAFDYGNHRVANALTKRVMADPNTYAKDINKGTLRHERAQEYVENKHGLFYDRRFCHEGLSPMIDRGSAALNKDAYNQTLLHFAISLKELKATPKRVDRLCEFGSLNSQDYRGQTPLHKMACQLPANLDQADLYKADQWLYSMLNRRPDVNIKDVYGKTWLDYVGIHCKFDKLQAFVRHAFKKKLNLQPSTLKQAFKEYCWHHEIKPKLVKLQKTDPRSNDVQQCFKAYHPQYDSELDTIWEQQLTNHLQSMADRLGSAVEKVRDYIKSTGADLIFESSQKLAVASTTNGVRLSSSGYTVTGVHPRQDQDESDENDENAQPNAAKAARLNEKDSSDTPML